MDEWQTLIKRYADGRHICNCGNAYLSPVGRGMDSKGYLRDDMLTCSGGCASNQITAREEVAEKIMAEFRGAA